jgi:hypothetical protein
LTLYSTTGFIIKLSVEVEPIYEEKTMNTKTVKEQGNEERQITKTTGEVAPVIENEKPECGCCGGRKAEKK